MPKVIDKYVLEQKIGNGQFGQVYHGKHQDTLEEVAIKSIRRDMIKGKFYELLENEIKVLKACDNPYIIKLYALRKTPHNYYLMLEFCNGGDMLAKVRKQGSLPEDEVIKYLCQILNAFQTLVRHKIMHRDFKLANILLHDGNIKVADFGFAKLLSSEDYATTMLGSPLNMAPEVLGGTKYNNKADIWSIGACIYQMVFGKPPFIANNMVDLAKLIKNKPLVFPAQKKICDQLKDVLQRMLTPDTKKRIEWHDLFNHPITGLLAKRQKGKLQLELAEDESLLINTSKCYIKNNLVLSDIKEIKSKSQINDYLVDIIRHGKKSDSVKEEAVKPESHLQKTKSSKSNKNNSKRILHFRNVYAFLASLADQIINKQTIFNHEIAAYVIVRKILSMIDSLLKTISGDQCTLTGIQNWKQYRKQSQFLEIYDYIGKEYEVFTVFNQSLQPIIKKKSLAGAYDADVKELIASKQLKDNLYGKYLKSYLFPFATQTTMKALNQKYLNNKDEWKLIFFGLKIIDVWKTFGIGEKEFDFKHFYDSFDHLEQEEMLCQIQNLIQQNR